MKSLIQDSLDCRLIFISNEFLHQNLPHHFLGAVTHQSHRALIPHIDCSLRVHTEDRRVGSVDQLGVLPLLGQSCRNVLTDPHHANHVALFITSARSVKKHLYTISTLGDQWKLEVGRLVSREGLIEHGLDGSLEIVGDEILDQ